MASKLPQISQVMACWVHFCFACLSCPSAPQVDKWFTTKPMETADGLVMTAIGNFCFWCGHTTEAWPLEVPETLAQRFHSNLAFRGTFTAIREKLQNMADFGTEFRNESVLTTKDCGLRLFKTLAFITADALTAFFNMDMTKVPGIKMCRLAAPEGGELEGMVVSTASVPAGIPFMTVEAFATTYCQAEDKLLSGKDIVRQGQAADMHSFATKLMVDARPPALKASQLMSPMDFAVMQGKVYKVQEKLRAQEAEQRLQNEGTDGASVTGLAGVGIGVITSSSRLSAPMFAVPAEEAPRKAGQLQTNQ